jgi:hypothetical protein
MFKVAAPRYQRPVQRPLVTSFQHIEIFADGSSAMILSPNKSLSGRRMTCIKRRLLNRTL